MKDKNINCVDCVASFVFSVRDQEFYQSKNYSEPKRCRKCRDLKKQRIQG